MDFNELVSEIVARVARRLEDNGAEKPALLVLTPAHGEACHAVLESPRLMEHYRLDCALQNEYCVNVDAYEGVILFGLTNEALARLAGGVCDTPFTALAQKAILAGKKLFICEEEIELFRYRQSAPAPYYHMLAEQLALLQACGLTVCALQALEQVILSGVVPVCKPAAATCGVQRGTGSASITKKIVTERDMESVCIRGTGTLHIGRKTILTDLARDYAHARRIEIVRE